MLVLVSNCKCKLHISVYQHSGDSDSDVDRAAQQQTAVHEFRGFVFLLLHISYCPAWGQKVYTHTFLCFMFLKCLNMFKKLDTQIADFHW